MWALDGCCFTAVSAKLSYSRKSIHVFLAMKKEMFSDFNVEFKYFENLKKLFFFFSVEKDSNFQ